ncbi:hypothetical protein E5D57_013592 [Metarhizium anisopliae]|nr:hypothetical protein E5D57_013592 [Metarhizium anisopliae]
MLFPTCSAHRPTSVLTLESLVNWFNSSYVLSRYYTRDPKDSQHADAILRTLLLDHDAKMNPNLGHVQIIPCTNAGRAIGITDLSQEYINVRERLHWRNSGTKNSYHCQQTIAVAMRQVGV